MIERATILDVAAAAGVSRQTVTRAMNDMADISPATRRRVLETAAKLGYRPSRFASNLARQKSLSVGIVVTSLRDPYFAELSADLIDAITAQGWSAVMASYEPDDEPGMVRGLAQQVDLIVGYLEADEAVLAEAAQGVPVILVDRHATVPGISSIAIDFRGGMRDFLSGLRERGSQRFGMLDALNIRDDSYVPSERRLCFEEFAGDDATVVVLTSDRSWADAEAGLKRLREISPEVDTVVCFNDVMAIGAMHGARGLGISVPGDLRIAGINGLSIGGALTPELTSLSIDSQAIAADTVALTETLLASHDRGTETRTVRPRTLWRESA